MKITKSTTINRKVNLYIKRIYIYIYMFMLHLFKRQIFLFFDEPIQIKCLKSKNEVDFFKTVCTLLAVKIFIRDQTAILIIHAFSISTFFQVISHDGLAAIKSNDENSRDTFCATLCFLMAFITYCRPRGGNCDWEETMTPIASMVMSRFQVRFDCKGARPIHTN